MKGKNNSKSTNKSPNKNLKQDEMKKNPILPNKKGNGKKDVVKEEPKPKPAGTTNKNYGNLFGAPAKKN